MFCKTSLALAAVCALSLSLEARSAWAAQPDICGSYRCTGSNPNGSQYSGSVKITRRGSGYRIEWTIAGKSHGGVGILEGNVFSACWNIRGTQEGGIVVYRVEPGRRLVGRWSMTRGDDGVYTETLTSNTAVSGKTP